MDRESGWKCISNPPAAVCGSLLWSVSFSPQRDLKHQHFLLPFLPTFSHNLLRCYKEINSPQLFSSSVQKLGGLSEVIFSDVFLLRSAGQARRPLTFCALANKNIFSCDFGKFIPKTPVEILIKSEWDDVKITCWSGRKCLMRRGPPLGLVTATGPSPSRIWWSSSGEATKELSTNFMSTIQVSSISIQNPSGLISL